MVSARDNVRNAWSSAWQSVGAQQMFLMFWHSFLIYIIFTETSNSFRTFCCFPFIVNSPQNLWTGQSRTYSVGLMQWNWKMVRPEPERCRAGPEPGNRSPKHLAVHSPRGGHKGRTYCLLAPVGWLLDSCNGLQLSWLCSECLCDTFHRLVTLEWGLMDVILFLKTGLGSCMGGD